MWRASLVPILAAILLAGCSSDKQPTSKDVFTGGDPALSLRTAQYVLASAGGYRIRFEQSNFVLPQWGGIDNGVVEVSKDGTSAKAILTRTGEKDATYTVTLTDGKTYFQRSTCQETFRIPGGGADVLKPFLLARTNALANAAPNASWAGAAIHVAVDGLGPVDIALDEKTGRPSQIRGTSNNLQQVWKFEAYGVNPNVSAPFGNVQERGPGGIPC
jgi:hypothetical protein